MEESNPLQQFAMLSVIGKGSYAKVVLVRKKSTGELFALKSMKKKYIEKKNQVERIKMEKEILTQIHHPFLINIHSSFQNQKKLFLTLEYCAGGELFGLLLKKKKLSEDQARFYAAQMLLAIEYLHSLNIIYRDLKPENVLICADGYIKLTDFGLSKSKIFGDNDAFSVCGTPQYLAPEVISKKGHGKAVDWWCLGSIIYELIHGLPPFYTKNRNQLFEKIRQSQPYMNKQWSKNLRDLFLKLFLKNPEERMQWIPMIKSHPWFESVNWQMLLEKKLKSPFIPIIKTDCDVSNFASQFTECDVESYNESLGEGKILEGFSYERSKSPITPPFQKMQEEEIPTGFKLEHSEEIVVQMEQESD